MRRQPCALQPYIMFCNGGHVEFWKLAEHSQEQWWLEHPLREHILREPERFIPYRIFGDEISLGKNNRPTLGILWCGSTARIKALLMKLLLFMSKWDSETEMDPIFRGITWSFNCLAFGTWPTTDMDGHPFDPRSRCGRMAGKSLTPNGWCAIYTQTTGGWKWKVDKFHIEQK